MSKRANYAGILNGLVAIIGVMTIEDVEELVNQGQIDSAIRLGDGDAEPEIGTPSDQVMSSGLGIYALIKDSNVTNVIRADSAFLQSLIDSEQIDETVFLGDDDVRPNIGDNYIDGVFSSALSKPEALSIRVEELKIAIFDLRDSLYDENTREAFNNATLSAFLTNKTNRLTYLMQLVTWVDSIYTMIGEIITSLQGLPTAQEVLDYQWDLSPIVATDPHLTLLAAFQIPD